METRKKSLPVRRISPADGQYFFGYYDLQPFNKTEKYHLAHKTSFADRLQVKGDYVQLGIIDTQTDKFECIEETKAWNFQQGAMLQWNPMQSEDEIIFNTISDGAFAGTVMNIQTGKKRLLERPLVNVSPDGKYGISVNMSRMYDFRPGYGYAEYKDPNFYKKHPKDDGVFIVDMETGKSKLVLSLDEIWNTYGSYFEKDEKIMVNHITFNTDGSRFLMLVRNFPENGMWRTALITANRDGSDMYLLSDFGVQSHYYWINKENIVIFGDGKELKETRGWASNYIMKDRSHDGNIMSDGYFDFDNHMSMSPDRKYMLTDTYPDEKYLTQPLFICDNEKQIIAEVGRFYSMPASVIDIRCDLHPRWSRQGDKITFDSTHEGFRGIYQVDFTEEVKRKLFKI